MKIRSLFCAVVIMILSACQPSKLLATSTPASTATNTLTPIPTNSPSVTPTPIGGGNGTILYSEGWTLYSIDTSGRNKNLIDENCSFNITFSPDGHYATCSMAKQIKDNNWGGYGVTLIDLQSYKVVKRLAASALVGQEQTSRLFGSYPTVLSWSPNSKQFAFIGTYEGETGLYVIDIENSSTTLLFKSPNLYDLKWSPEGTKLLLFELVEPPSWKFNLYVIGLDGTQPTKLTENPATFVAFLSKWGDDDNTIFLNNGGMEGINLDTMKPNGEILPIPDPYPLVIPSPDHQFNLIVGDMSSGKIFLESNDDSQKTDITKYFTIDTTRPNDIQWSPNSKTLAHYDPKEKSIVLFSVESLTLSVLTKVAQDDKSQWSIYYGHYLWLPDSKQIIFIQADGSGGFDVSLVDLFGNATKLFTAKYPVGIHVKPQ